jgi:hypothetical protein
MFFQIFILNLFPVRLKYYFWLEWNEQLEIDRLAKKNSNYRLIYLYDLENHLQTSSAYLPANTNEN